MKLIRNYRSFIVLAMAAVWAMPASATLFTLGSYDISYLQSDPGLVLGVEKLVPEPVSANLTAGNVYTYNLFRVYTPENSIDNLTPGDTTPASISVKFNFTAPGVVSETVSGVSYGQIIFGVVKWNGPATFEFGTGGKFTIELSDVYFLANVFGQDNPYGAIVSATLDFKSDSQSPPTQVPEPSAVVLLGAGLLGLGMLRRRRRA